jgi:hypothetical protein
VTGQRKSLIIANDQYEQESLRDLVAPEADAVALGRVLGDPQIGGFAVQVIRNEPAHVIEAQIEDLFLESRPDDVLLVHYSGHGLKSESGELFFAASNTRPNRLRATAVSADFVQRCMQDARSRSIVLLLDCCYGGAFSPGVRVRAARDANVLDSFPQGTHGGGRGRAVITASNAMEYAFEGDRLADDRHQRPSVFTSALVAGLATGDADRDEDGLISLSELYDYVYDKVREQNPNQTPSRQIDLEGELYLARSRRRRIRPDPVPADLKAAMGDPSMYARRGAVHELESRLASEDLPVAAGAYEALAEIARTDIKYVADLASAALSRAAVQPLETELHFGEIRQGSEPPHRMVRLLGPPLARVCTPRVSDDWIRVAETTGGIEVFVDTTGTGVLLGRVDLSGPTGTAVITVKGELLPQAAQASTARPAALAGEDTPPEVPAAPQERRPAGKKRTDAQQASARSPAFSAAPSVVRVFFRKGAAPASRREAWAGSLAVASAAMAFVDLLPTSTYMSGGRYIGSDIVNEGGPLSAMTPWWSWFIAGAAALALIAGASILIRRRQSPLGHGLLLAATAATIPALAYSLSRLAPSFNIDDFAAGHHLAYGGGYWLQLASSLSLIIAAYLTISALARADRARLIGWPPRNRLLVVVVLLGVAGALALAFQDFQLWFPPAGNPANVWKTLAIPSIVMTFWALVLPAMAMAVAPRRLGIALLGGWIWAGGIFFVFSYLFRGTSFGQGSKVPVIVFGITLLLLTATTIVLARKEPAWTDR